MELKYTITSDYELPNLTLNDNKKGPINKYGMLRLDYLKQHKKALYTTLLMKDELTNHLVSVSKNAENLLNNLMESYKKSDEKLSEKSKETNQIEWAKLMNNYKKVTSKEKDEINQIISSINFNPVIAFQYFNRFICRTIVTRKNINIYVLLR